MKVLSSICVLTAALLASALSVVGKALVVGEGQGGWTLGVPYPPLLANVGDTLVFAYTPGIHDVWSVPEAKCSFALPAALLGAANASQPHTVALTAPGVYHYACSFTGHCEAGMLLRVQVVPASAPATGNISISAFAALQGATGLLAGQLLPTSLIHVHGNATCGPRITDPATGIISVSCLTPAVSLAPGENFFPEVELPNPYPLGVKVAVQTTSMGVVDATGRQVPLDEVYLHHMFGDYNFLMSESAEARGSPKRHPLPAPYAQVINGSDYAARATRMCNIHLINTVGVPASAVKPCIECLCPGSNPSVGSIGCCAKCNSTATLPPKDYFLQINVTYRPLISAEEEAAVVPITSLNLDIHGGIEYSVQATTAVPHPVDRASQVYALDFVCPQQHPFAIIMCWSHQHIGGACARMFDNATGALICESCPVYGTEPSVPGNEKGYLVAMSPTVLTPPYQVAPGQVVRLEADYNTDQAYSGVMSGMILILANFTARPECRLDYTGSIQPPISNPNGAADVQELTALLEAVPPSCPQRPFVDDMVLPCLAMATASVSGRPVGMADTAACCTAVKAKSAIYAPLYLIPTDNDALIGAMYLNPKSPPACQCASAQALAHAAKHKLVYAMIRTHKLCGRDAQQASYDTYADTASTFVQVDPVSPFCPPLQQFLSSTNGTAAAGVAKTQP